MDTGASRGSKASGVSLLSAVVKKKGPRDGRRENREKLKTRRKKKKKKKKDVKTKQKEER